MPECDEETCDNEATVVCPDCGVMLCNDDSPGDGGECPNCGQGTLVGL